MMLRRVWSLLAAGAVVATAAGRGAADDCCAPCAPATCKVTVVEDCPETVPVTRTVYKTECRQEAYTAYRCEMVRETKPCTRTVMKSVCETVNETRTVCVRVPVTEQKTVMTTRYNKVMVTEMRSNMVDHGHWECREVPAPPSLRDRLGRLCGKKSDCCECPKTVTKKCWVPCMVCEQCPVTVCKTVCEQVPTTVCVTTCRYETRTETCPVTRYRCVPEQVTEMVTVCTPRTVPYQATRTVRCCVPVTETCMVTRMVPRCVEKEVAVQTSCGSCGACCSTTAHHHKARKHKEKACCY